MKKNLDIALMWFTAATIASLPFLIFNADFPTAFFESCSALSSVGITSISKADNLYFYRAFLAFFGGILFLITLPHLISTSDSYKFAMHEKLSVKNMIFAYIFIFVLGAILYLFYGEDLTDSVVISALAVSTTGGIILTKDLIAPTSFLMFLSVIFPLLCILIEFKFKNISVAKREQLQIFAAVFLIAFFYLILNKIYPREAIFYILSFFSTAGFILEDFYKISNHPLYVLCVFSIMGGLIGGIGGGLKIFRLIVLFKILFAELKHTLYPRSVIVIKLNNSPIPSRIIGKVLIYFFLYCSGIFVFTLIFAFFGATYENAAAMSLSFASLVGILPPDFKNYVFELHPLLKIIVAFIFLIFRLKIFIFFIMIQYFYEKIFTLGVHSWKKL